MSADRLLRSHAAEHALIGSIYSTIETAEAWREVVPSLARYVGAESALMFTPLDAHLPRGFGFTHKVPEESLRAYGAHYHACDVWKEAADRLGLLKAGALFRSEQILPMKTMLGSEIYADLWRPLDIAHLLCAGLTDEQHTELGPSTLFSFFRGRRRGEFSDVQAKRCRTLMPHLRRALLAAWRLEGVQRLLDVYQAALHSTGDVILVLGTDMTLHHASSQPREVFGPGSPLQITHGRLSAATFEKRSRLEAAARDAASGRPSGAVRMEAPDGSELEVSILRHGSRRLVARIRRIRRSAHDAAARIAARFRLTQAEQRVLTLLAGGSSVAEIAAELSIRPMTARTHLANLFEKTGTHSQGKLIALVWQQA